MSRHNARQALKPEDRPPGEDKNERIKATDLAIYKTEEEIQVEVCNFLDATLPKDWRWFHPPNGGWRKKATASRLKAMGVKPGVPDIVIMRPKAANIFIELKSFGGVLTESQKAFRAWAIEAGHVYHVARSCGEVSVILKEYVGRS